MLLSAVSVLAVAQSSLEIPEGLMNNPVYIYIYIHSLAFEIPSNDLLLCLLPKSSPYCALREKILKKIVHKYLLRNTIT